jgi:hypothetical protein
MGSRSVCVSRTIFYYIFKAILTLYLKHVFRLDPTIVHPVLDQKLLCCSFANSAPVLVTGDEAGAVNVYKLHRLQLFRDSRDLETMDGMYSHVSLVDAKSDRTVLLEELVGAKKKKAEEVVQAVRSATRRSTLRSN